MPTLMSVARAVAVVLAAASAWAAECGQEGHACCDGLSSDLSVCGAGLACWHGLCEQCGVEGAPGCGGSDCFGGLHLTAAGLCHPRPPSVAETLHHAEQQLQGEPYGTHTQLQPHIRQLTDAACGDEYQDCCENDGCNNPRLACVTALCVPCGADPGPACTDPSVPPCDDRLLFDAEISRCRPGSPPPVICGGRAEQCCTEGPACEMLELACSDQGLCDPCGGAYNQPCDSYGVPPCFGPLVLDDYGALCVQDFSSPPGAPCGGEFGFCCEGGGCDNPESACVEGRCYPCGTLGQRACGADYADFELIDYVYATVPTCFFFLQPGAGLVCDEGPCGAQAELCCDRTACDDDLVCYKQLCRPCGTPGQAGCDYTEDDFVDEPGVNEPFCFTGLYLDNDVICRVPEPGQDFGQCLEGGQCEGDDINCYLEESDGGVCLAYEYSTACGYEGVPCCGRTTCEVGLGCADDTCSPCGAQGFPPCTDVGFFQCAPGLAVGEGGLCGLLPRPPPPSPMMPPVSLPQGPPLGKPPGMRPCGMRLARCCTGDAPTCGDGLVCFSTVCLPCGGGAQRACVDSETGDESCSEGFEMRSGICIPSRKRGKFPFIGRKKKSGSRGYVGPPADGGDDTMG
eukprot:jgi/Ulvmu1/12533/UM090_0020.1